MPRLRAGGQGPPRSGILARKREERGSPKDPAAVGFAELGGGRESLPRLALFDAAGPTSLGSKPPPTPGFARGPTRSAPAQLFRCARPSVPSCQTARAQPMPRRGCAATAVRRCRARPSIVCNDAWGGSAAALRASKGVCPTGSLQGVHQGFEVGVGRDADVPFFVVRCPSPSRRCGSEKRPLEF